MGTAKQNAITRAKGFEGLSTHMYKDQTQVDVGYGHKISGKPDLADIAMVIESTSANATDVQKATEYDAVLKGQSPDTLILANGEADRLIGVDMDGAESLCSASFSKYSSFPQTAQEALLDMAFNLGASKFNENEWPVLFKAVSAQDWKQAASNCHRKKPVPEDRNIETKRLFDEAAGPSMLDYMVSPGAVAAPQLLREVRQAITEQLATGGGMFDKGVNFLKIEVHLGPNISASVEVRGPPVGT